MRLVTKISILLALFGLLTVTIQHISSDENSIDLTRKSTSSWELISDNPLLTLR